MGSGKAMGTIKECYAYCNATKGCEGFVWDEIPGEISGQCKGKHGQGCCIVKPACGKFVAKKGDTAVTYGAPAVPAKPPTPGKAHDHRWGSGLHSSQSASNDRADRAGVHPPQRRSGGPAVLAEQL